MWELRWNKAERKKLLEVGAGTGKIFPFYQLGTEITSIDFSTGMLLHARAKARKYDVKASLLDINVQNLEFEDNTFHTVVASVVFCSVPHPVRGLMEVKREYKAGGKVVLLKHVLSDNPAAAWLMNTLNFLGFCLVGDKINRETVKDVINSGLAIERVIYFYGWYIQTD
jgi:ubiquinone/menaquinone biosynthesis C-methylase UbiE